MIEELKQKLAEETQKILQNRLLAWATGCDEFDLMGISLRPLTGRAWIDLRLIENALVCQGEITDDEIMAYIWRNSKKYSFKKSRKAEKEKKKIGFLYEKFNSEILALVFEHLDFAFQEVQSSSQSGNSISYSNQIIEDVDHMIKAVDEVAARYGQNPIEVLDWPINQILQFQKALRLSTIPDYKLKEPESIRKIKSEILTELNK